MSAPAAMWTASSLVKVLNSLECRSALYEGLEQERILAYVSLKGI